MARATSERRSREARAAARQGHARPSRIPRLGWLLGGALAVAVLAALGVYLMAGRAGGSDDAIAVLRTSDFHALAFSSDDPNVVFFGQHNGLLRSNDGGHTWRPLVDRRNFDAMGLAVSRTNAARLYVAGHDVFQASTDGGATWQPVAHNLPGSDVHGFAMSPDDPSRLYAFVVRQGLFTSADGGQTWQRLAGQLPGDVMALAAAGGSPETLYAGSMAARVLRSADGGQSWSPATNGLDSRNVMALTVDPVARHTVYAGTDRGLYKSTDDGATWSKLPFPSDNAVTLAVSPTQPNVLLAIGVKNREGLVYRSEDGGQSWGSRQ